MVGSAVEFTPKSSPLKAAMLPLVCSLLALMGLGAWVGGLLPLEIGRGTVVGPAVFEDDRPTVERLALQDSTGTSHQVGGVSQSSATVVVYLSATCPISRGFLPMLERLHRAAARRGVRVLAIQIDQDVSLSAEFEISFPVFSEQDHLPNTLLRRHLKPTHVPEAFVIDSNGRLSYRGRIDDRFVDLGRRRAAVTSRDLVRAIDRVLAGRSRRLEQTTPVGCALEPLPSQPGRDVSKQAKSTRQVTWSGTVASLVHRRCGRCHRPDTAAPFSLLTYQDVAVRRRQVLDVVTRKIMPPWKPRAGFGHFQDDLRLGEEELALLRGWLESDLPRGDATVEPVAPKYAGGWSLGRPDLVLTMPERISIPADGRDIYWYFVIPSGLKTDRMISAIEFRPGNSRVVHHASFRYDDTGTARRLDAADPQSGYRRSGGWGFGGGGTLGGWAVGVQPRHLDPGLGRSIKAGSDFVLQVHYHPSGRVESDQSQLGLYFLPDSTGTSADPSNSVTPVIEILVGEMSLEIPAGESNLHHSAVYTLPVPVTVHSVLPHMHLLGRRCRAWAETPSGQQLPLVAIDEWDFHWHSQYHLQQPLRLPAGTRLIHEAWYDNSAANPFNPHSPPRRVTWGEGTDQEMGLLFLDVTTDSSTDRQRLIHHNQSHFLEQFRRLTGGR
ncbi:MAG: alkyl hydroperoxide reductase [Planctomycetota bacterium]|nr:alkyl hydroperoxide reductase [Planctomycetota bacterium]